MSARLALLRALRNGGLEASRASRRQASSMPILANIATRPRPYDRAMRGVRGPEDWAEATLDMPRGADGADDLLPILAGGGAGLAASALMGTPIGIDYADDLGAQARKRELIPDRSRAALLSELRRALARLRDSEEPDWGSQSGTDVFPEHSDTDPFVRLRAMHESDVGEERKRISAQSRRRHLRNNDNGWGWR